MGIEPVVLLVQRLSEGIYRAVWVKLMPGIATLVAITGLQDHHKGVEAADDLVKISVGDLVVFVFVRVGAHVDRLMWVVLEDRR